MAQQLLLSEWVASDGLSLFPSLSSEVWHAGQSPGWFPDSPGGYAFDVHRAQASSTENVPTFPFHSDVRVVLWGPFPWSTIYQVFALPTIFAWRTDG